jgi:hypothetical protein
MLTPRRRRSRWTSLAVVLAAAAASGCRPPTDLNRPCELIRPAPDGGTPIPLLESEVQAAVGRNKDFIAFGQVTCDDLICVRDADYVNQSDAGVDGGARVALGYCSRSCLPAAGCPSSDPALDQGSTRLNCRPLLLDQRSLAGLDAGDLGAVRDPYFCARGHAADAG